MALAKRTLNALRKKHVAHPDDNTAAGLRAHAAETAADIAADVDKLFGKGTVIQLSGETDLSEGGIPTGYQEIDDILSGGTDKHGTSIKGVGVGFPKGRMIEIYGPESSAKTSLALLAIAHAQEMGGTAAFVDAEHALDTAYARYLGVDVESLLIFQPDTAEDTVAYVKALVKRKVDIIVVDSIAAMTPKSELVEGVKGKGGMGEHARIMSAACRQINAALKPGGPVVIWINQIRMKIGVMFGNPETTTGGNAMKFYASIRLDLRKIKTLIKQKGGEKKVVGVRIRARTIKNKIVPPFRDVIFDIIFNVGIFIVSKETLREEKLKGKEDDE
jgi:recombination protein RecA